MDKLERDVALANHNDDSVPAYVEPEEHHAYAAEQGAPGAVLGERDDSSSADPADPDAEDPTADMRRVDPEEEDRAVAEAVVDIVFSNPEVEIESEEPAEEPEEERLGRKHKHGNHPGSGATLAPLNEPAEPARHEQIREENTRHYDPEPGPMDEL